MGTMLLIVGWSAVVVWLNVRPRVVCEVLFISLNPPGSLTLDEEFGWPLTVAVGVRSEQSHVRQFHNNFKWPLAANIAIGLLAVAVLTFASKYLVRAIVAGVRAIVGKPPPSKGNGPERASDEELV